ncbi:hypothetical protein D0862_14284 [Hortaea werneckii]|uniref:Uncharacterized protein n=1 Tax=Hortaea werneckii TaxID=91943 RepID=A0A3M7D663_HORWE|nr:hypothetical protein D0863_11966 [Hortaea werneckii]RMY73470.1 hypothetical protein D0862_14284 [Hortaea werneckii]
MFESTCEATYIVLTLVSKRKKPRARICPRGYVEALEQQQSWMVKGLQDMYRRLLEAGAWTGPSLVETDGRPFIHDILSALCVLHSDHDDNVIHRFEESCQALQSKLLASGAELTDYQKCTSRVDQGKCQLAEFGDGKSLRESEAQTAPPEIQGNAMGSNLGDNLGCQTRQTDRNQRQALPWDPYIGVGSFDSTNILTDTYSPLEESFNQLPQFSLRGDDPQFYQAEWAFSRPQALPVSWSSDSGHFHRTSFPPNAWS